MLISNSSDKRRDSDKKKENEPERMRGMKCEETDCSRLSDPYRFPSLIAALTTCFFVADGQYNGLPCDLYLNAGNSAGRAVLSNLRKH